MQPLGFAFWAGAYFSNVMLLGCYNALEYFDKVKCSLKSSIVWRICWFKWKISMYAKLFELYSINHLKDHNIWIWINILFISLVGVKPWLMSLKSSLIMKNLNLKRTNKF